MTHLGKGVQGLPTHPLGGGIGGDGLRMGRFQLLQAAELVVVVEYFPESEKEPNRECYNTAERMFACLEQIALEGGSCRGTRRRYKVVDGRLNFFVNYDCILRREGEEQSMGEMTSRTEVKEGG